MLKRIFIALVPIFLSKDQTQNNASMRCFVFPDFTYAVVKVLLDITSDHHTTMKLHNNLS